MAINELQLHRIVWMNLTNIVLSERRQIYLFNFIMFKTGKLLYLVVRIMVTLMLLVTGRGTMKISGMLVMIYFLMVVVAQVCLPPNILNCHLDLHVFACVLYLQEEKQL